jgi:Icc-related predicted phosphoesterase
VPKLICISDTHSNFPKTPKGGILIHAGDLTNKGTEEQLRAGLEWLEKQPSAVKILVPGNHDFIFQREPEKARGMCEEHNIVLLMDEEYRAEGLWFWGSPWQPWFHDWAFNLKRGPEIQAKWDRIPQDTDVLITHGPAMGFLDATPRAVGDGIGCEDLMRTMLQIQPKLHVFGHVHHSYGVRKGYGSLRDTLFVNASLCDENNSCINHPITVHL